MRCHRPLVVIQTVSQTSRTDVGRARFDAMRPGRIVLQMIALDTDQLTAILPNGYRARPFEDRDREPMVAERNTWVGPMEQGSAEEWRGGGRRSARHPPPRAPRPGEDVRHAA